MATIREIANELSFNRETKLFGFDLSFEYFGRDIVATFCGFHNDKIIIEVAENPYNIYTPAYGTYNKTFYVNELENIDNVKEMIYNELISFYGEDSIEEEF